MKGRKMCRQHHANFAELCVQAPDPDLPQTSPEPTRFNPVTSMQHADATEAEERKSVVVRCCCGKPATVGGHCAEHLEALPTEKRQTCANELCGRNAMPTKSCAASAARITLG